MSVDTFLEEMDAQLIEADIIDCWDASKGDVLQQCDTGCFAEVVSYLDELVTRPPTRETWDRTRLLGMGPTPGGGNTGIRPCQG